MSERLNDSECEKLSAFLDGELSEQAQAGLVGRLAEQAELRSQLARFQAISAQLQQNEPPLVDASSVSEAVRRRVKDEPAVLAPRRRRPRIKVRKVALGTALAATVAGLAVSVAPQLLDPGAEALPAENFAFAPRLSVPEVDATKVSLGGSVSGTAENSDPGQKQRWKRLQPDVLLKLDRYLLEHNEFAGRHNVTHPSAHVGFVSGKNAQR